MTSRPFRFGVVAAHARSGKEWMDKARRAEELGYSTFLVPDTLGQTLAPLPALAFAAAATTSIRVGSFVLANDFRHPVMVAREAAALDLLSGGRFELGLGAGRSNAGGDYRMLGIPFDPGSVRVERLAESVRIIRALLDGQRVTVTGPHYTVADVELFPRSTHQPPILLAARGQRLLSLAAREADIVSLAFQADESPAAVAEKVHYLREAAGERFEQLELGSNLVAAGQQMPNWLSSRLGLDSERLIQAGSLAVLMGTPDEMCEQLLDRKDTLGISYITLNDYLMEEFAPVLERLSGR